jgi:hypothetical protein
MFECPANRRLASAHLDVHYVARVLPAQLRVTQGLRHDRVGKHGLEARLERPPPGRRVRQMGVG